MNLMIVVVPRYGIILMTTSGLLLLATICGYLSLLPDNPLIIHVDGNPVYFDLGWCFWLIFFSGNYYYISFIPKNVVLNSKSVD